MQARELTAQVSSQLFFSETPLDTQQAERLTRLFASAPGYRGNWSGALEEARGFLRPEQVEVVAGLQAASKMEQEFDAAVTPPAK